MEKEASGRSGNGEQWKNPNGGGALSFASETDESAGVPANGARVTLFTRAKTGLESFADKIPEGTMAKAYWYGTPALGALVALTTKDRRSFITAAQGLAGAAVASTVSSFVGHHIAAHGQWELSPKTLVTARFVHAALVGLKLDRSVPAHLAHHANPDTPKDPHSPRIQGWLNVVLGLPGMIKEYARNNPERITHAQSDPRTRRMAFDRSIVTAAGVIGVNMLAGRLAHQHPVHSLVSAVIEEVGLYTQLATFTADAHKRGKATNIRFGPFLSACMGGETRHGDHHENPGNPRHAFVDPPYTIGRTLEMAGLAKRPARPPEKAA